MQTQSGAFPSNPRPDLEEFLSALDGFLSNESSSPSDPSYFKFLGIFCRSIGASEGHLLRSAESNGLQSIVSFGMGKNFDGVYNKIIGANPTKDSPPDISFNKKEVMAIVDLEKDPEIPKWYMDLMKKKDFRSLVAVPLMGQENAMGVLCAFYHDVCLFDQGTLDHLMMIGRMVGTSLEKETKNQSKSRESEHKSQGVVDRLIRSVVGKIYTPGEIYSLAAKAANEALNGKGAVCGPIKKFPEGFGLTMVGHQGLMKKPPAKPVILPSFIQKVLTNPKNQTSGPVKIDLWGDLKPFIGEDPVQPLIFPLLWNNKVSGFLMGWRSVGPAFDEDNLLDLSRIAGITSLSLKSH